MNPIEKIKGPCVVLAGAGTGKTRTIVEKVKYLIDFYKPEKIVCITFSNEAANSLQVKIQRILNSENNSVIVRTFHGFSSDLLKKYGNKIGISPDFKILDPNEAKVVLHANLKVPAGNCGRYVSSIGQAKDLGIIIEKLQDYFNKETLKYSSLDLEKTLENLQFEFQTLHMRTKSEKSKLLVKEIKDLSDLINLNKFICSWKAYEKIKKIKN